MFRQKIKSLLRQPLALETGMLAKYRQALFFGVFVFLFLFLFQPFGLQQTGPDLLRITLGYGVVCFLVMIFLNILVIRLFPRYFDEENWTLGRDIFWNLVNILTIGFFNLVFSSRIGISSITPTSILYLEFYTLLVAIFPVSLAIIWKEKLLRTRHEKASREMTGMTTQLPASGTLIHVPSENQGEAFDIPPDALVFLQSAENYIEIYFTDREQTKKAVIRYTLKQLTQDWEEHRFLFRCHKSFLINTRRITEVTGNAQGLRVRLLGTDRVIPVSRQLTSELKKRMPAVSEGHSS